MNFWLEIAIVLGEKYIDFDASLPKNAQSESMFRKYWRVIQLVFTALMLGFASFFPAWTTYIIFTNDQPELVYLLSVFSLTVLTMIMSIVIFYKTSLFTKEYLEVRALRQTIILDEIKYEIGVQVLLFILACIPFAHIVFCPLVIDKGVSVLEITDTSNSEIRKRVANLAGYAVLAFTINSVVISFVFLLLGTKPN